MACRKTDVLCTLGRWVIEQDFYVNFWVNVSWFMAAKIFFFLGPGSTKTVIHVCYNGAIIEHPVDV